MNCKNCLNGWKEIKQEVDEYVVFWQWWVGCIAKHKASKRIVYNFQNSSQVVEKFWNKAAKIICWV